MVLQISGSFILSAVRMNSPKDGSVYRKRNEYIASRIEETGMRKEVTGSRREERGNGNSGEKD